MKPVTAKPTPAEKRFDQAQEEAFSNEGAPPPAGAGAVITNADSWRDDESRTMAPSLTSRSTDDRGLAGRPAGETGKDAPSPGMPAKDAAGEPIRKTTALARVCSLLSVRLPSRSC